jgi:hypothetical protein
LTCAHRHHERSRSTGAARFPHSAEFVRPAWCPARNALTPMQVTKKSPTAQLWTSPLPNHPRFRSKYLATGKSDRAQSPFCARGHSERTGNHLRKSFGRRGAQTFEISGSVLLYEEVMASGPNFGLPGLPGWILSSAERLRAKGAELEPPSASPGCWIWPTPTRRLAVAAIRSRCRRRR